MATRKITILVADINSSTETYFNHYFPILAQHLSSEDVTVVPSVSYIKTLEELRIYIENAEPLMVIIGDLPTKNEMLLSLTSALKQSKTCLIAACMKDVTLRDEAAAADAVTFDSLNAGAFFSNTSVVKRLTELMQQN